MFSVMICNYVLCANVNLSKMSYVLNSQKGGKKKKTLWWHITNWCTKPSFTNELTLRPDMNTFWLFLYYFVFNLTKRNAKLKNDLLLYANETFRCYRLFTMQESHLSLNGRIIVLYAIVQLFLMTPLYFLIFPIIFRYCGQTWSSQYIAWISNGYFWTFKIVLSVSELYRSVLGLMMTKKLRFPRRLYEKNRRSQNPISIYTRIYADRYTNTPRPQDRGENQSYRERSSNL